MSGSDINYTMSNAEYHSHHDVLSSSGAKILALKTPAEFAHYIKMSKLKEGDEPTEAQVKGTAVHTLVFEPHMEKMIWKGPEARRNSKEWKELQEEADEAGCLLLKPNVYEEVHDMARAVRANGEVEALLSGSLVCEASVFTHDRIYDVPLRCRPDAWRKDIGVLIDLKTTVDPTPTGFGREVAKWGYHIQDQFYRRCMTLAGHEIDRFVFIAVGSAAPHLVYLYELDYWTLEEGASAVREALQTYSDCTKNNEWGYADAETIHMLSIPQYSYKFTQPE